MRLPVLASFFLWCTFFINTRAFSQNVLQDSSFENSSTQNAISLYHNFLYPEPNLYNGTQYAYKVYYPFMNTEGIPFFQSNIYDTGTVFYNDILYERVRMLYDAVKGELLLSDPSQEYIIKLTTEKIGWFIIYGHTFIRLNSDKPYNSSSHTGFYDELYKGGISLYKNVSKKIEETSTTTEIRRIITESNEYFIKKGDQYYSVKNRRGLKLALIDKKKEINQFIKKNGISLRKINNETFIKIITYYDRISN